MTGTGVLAGRRLLALEWADDTRFALAIKMGSAPAAPKLKRKSYAKLVCGIFNHRRVGGFAWLWRQRWQHGAVGQGV